MLFALSVCAAALLGGSSAVLGQVIEGSDNCADIPNWVPADALETANEPVFSVGESGIVTLDEMTLVWYNPNKTEVVGANAFEDPAPAPGTAWVCTEGAVGSVVQLPNGVLHNGECYDRCVYTAPLGDFVDGEATSTQDANGDYEVKGKLFVNNTEWFEGGFRDEPLTQRVIESTFPFQLRVPGTVAAATKSITGFFPPNLAAGITLQSVDVKIDDNFMPTAVVLIRTQYQWPFKFNISGFGINPQTVIPASIELLTDCADPGVVSNDGQDGTTVAPCDQIWKIELSPGAVRPQACQLDGTYTMTNLKIVCQPAFGGDCAATDDTDRVRIEFDLDSENFCPKILDDVTLGATLTAYNDVNFADESRNFLPGQTIYFKAVVDSPFVTVADTSLQYMSVTFGSSGSRVLQYDYESSGIATVQNLDTTTADAASSNVEVGFSFVLSDPPFTLPEDGSEDFVVDVVLEVTYVDVIDESNPLLLEERRVLLQVGSTGTTAPTRASTSVTLADGDASSASSFAASAAAAAAAAALLLA